jgi:hypothetical protein
LRDPQFGQKVHEHPSHTIVGHSGIHLSFQAMKEAETRSMTVLGQPGQKKFVRSHLKGKSLA